MQTIYKNEDEKKYSRGVNPVDTVIYARRINEYIKGKYLEDLETGLLKYETVGEFLAEIKKEFGRGDKKTVKIAKLKRLE